MTSDDHNGRRDPAGRRKPVDDSRQDPPPRAGSERGRSQPSRESFGRRSVAGRGRDDASWEEPPRRAARRDGLRDDSERLGDPARQQTSRRRTSGRGETRPSTFNADPERTGGTWTPPPAAQWSTGAESGEAGARWAATSPGRSPWGSDDHYAEFDDDYVEPTYEHQYVPAGKVVPHGAREARQKVGSRARSVTGPDGDGPEGVSPQRRRRRLILFGALVAVILIAIAAPWFWYRGQVNGSGGDGEQVAVSIPEGSSVAGIGKILNEAGVTGSPRAWTIYTRLNPPDDIQAGDYTLSKGMSFPDAIDVLVEGPTPLPVTKITIPEGLWLTEIAERVTEAGLDGDAFLGLATDGSVRSQWQPEGVTTLEGLLYPDTYFLGPDNTEADLLQAMIDRFDEQMASIDLTNTAPSAGLTPYEAIVMGSLIEGEAKLPADRANISSVMHNRIEKGMPLQIDATVIYAMGDRVSRVLYDDLEIDSPFNTYQNKGLPPSPIAASRVESIDAAVHPAATDYIYYMVISSDGAHGFASDEAGRQALFREAEANGVR